MSKATRKAEQEIPQELPQMVQLTMTADEFAVMALGLGLIMSVRIDDQPRMIEGLAIVHGLPKRMVRALESMSEKVTTGWHSIKVEELQ